MPDSFPAEVISLLEQILEPFRFEQCDFSTGGMGAWSVRFETVEFVVSASQDRSDDVLGICIGSRIRSKPRAHLRGPWPLSHLRGFLDGILEHFRFKDSDEQLAWLAENVDRLLNSEVLNSDELNLWAARASRRMFGQGD